MPEPLALSSESFDRLRPQSMERSQFLTKTPMGQQEVQAMDIGLLRTQMEKGRQDQQLMLKQREIQTAKEIAEKQMKVQKEIAQKEAWAASFPIFGGIIASLK